jgi:hypothetical protein
VEGKLIDYLEALTTDEKKMLGTLRRMIDANKFKVVNKCMENGLLISHSIGLTQFGLPEVVVYGLEEVAAATLFESLFALRKGSVIVPPRHKARMVMPENAPRLVPLLGCLFPIRATLMQVMWLDDNGFYPGHRRFAQGLLARQPRVWGSTRIPRRVIPIEVLAAEQARRKAGALLASDLVTRPAPN